MKIMLLIASPVSGIQYKVDSLSMRYVQWVVTVETVPVGRVCVVISFLPSFPVLLFVQSTFFQGGKSL